MLAATRKQLIDFLLVVVLFGGMLYAVVTSWQNQQALTQRAEDLKVVASDVRGIKQALVSVLLDERPDKPSIVRSLVTDADTFEGAEQFSAGQFSAAYAIWTDSARKGNSDSALAISLANTTLAKKLTDQSLSADERKSIESVLAKAPAIEVRQGVYYLKQIER